jgi:methionyl aminopeptidase
MTVRHAFELEALRKAGIAVATALRTMQNSLEVGITTRELDAIGRDVLESFGAQSAPETDYGFPGATCISVNEEVAHGIPGDRRIKAGDWVNLDVSACLNGYYADTGATIAFRSTDERLLSLRDCSQRALSLALKTARADRPIRAAGKAIESEARRCGFTTVKNLSGHGTGARLHEPPDGLVSYDEPKTRGVFKKGMVLAIETFVSTRGRFAHELDDGWTLVTGDGSFVAQFEHTVVVQDGEPITLTRVP